MEKVRWVIDMVRANGGMDYAAVKMNEYRTEAIQLLYQFPPTESRNSVEQLIEFTIKRKI
ncbi:MAG: polyprenyl synthetase family protein, partial [Bacteroidota bacterium]